MALVVESTADPAAAVRAVVQSLDEELPLRDVSMLTQAVEQRPVVSPGHYAALSRVCADGAADGFSGAVCGDRARDSEPHTGDWCAHGPWSERAQHHDAGDETRAVADCRRPGTRLAASYPATRVMANLPIGVSTAAPGGVCRGCRDPGDGRHGCVLAARAQSGGAGPGEGHSLRVGGGGELDQGLGTRD